MSPAQRGKRDCSVVGFWLGYCLCLQLAYLIPVKTFCGGKEKATAGRGRGPRGQGVKDSLLHSSACI